MMSKTMKDRGFPEHTQKIFIGVAIVAALGSTAGYVIGHGSFLVVMVGTVAGGLLGAVVAAALRKYVGMVAFRKANRQFNVVLGLLSCVLFAAGLSVFIKTFDWKLLASASLFGACALYLLLAGRGE